MITKMTNEKLEFDSLKHEILYELFMWIIDL